jgi:hypothetical protein
MRDFIEFLILCHALLLGMVVYFYFFIKLQLVSYIFQQKVA